MRLIAGTIDPDALLRDLASSRPVFHSEADFQHAFAWAAHQMDPTLVVRLETSPAQGLRLDLLLGCPDRNQRTAIELKYLTASWAGEVLGEHFALKNQAAQDIRAYDVVKDITRLERLVSAGLAETGLLVAITNDPSYWRPVSHGRRTNADAFRIYEGLHLSGKRSWGPNTGAGTMRGREAALDLLGSHHLRWRDFSRVDNGSRGTFRALVVEVQGARHEGQAAESCGL
jgi:hypothetical protein